ncbi:MAG: CBS domain-containing protein [Gammaproteobacteria bacterium]|nr:CBS domain-containing protein [Gammaproteobacteria bacterium]MDH5727830.1 CBS domain-containing protein [Gammaproteobacteria bacterium]
MSERKLIRVKEVMKTQFDLVDGMDTISQALKTMQHVETKCLIVQKRHDNDEYGMLLLSDIARKVLAKDLSADRINVYEVMTKPVMNVDPSMDIRYCARLFDRFDISRAPVVENGEVVGIVSFTDLVLKGFVNHI